MENKSTTIINSKMKMVNSVVNIEDKTIQASFIINDFEKSYNGDCITRDICEENIRSLINKPVLVQYFNEGDKNRDHLGSHGEYITKNRDTGEDIIATNTFAIGVFTNAYIDDMEIDGENKGVAVGDAILWADRYYNVCSLLNEWVERGIDIYCSNEYEFYNFEMKDGVRYIKSPYFYLGHTILNSEKKDGYDIVLPAYDSARMIAFNEALDKDLSRIKNEEEERVTVELENVFKKVLNEISLGETRDKIFSQLEKVMVAEEFNNMWISNYDIFNDYFIYETYMDNEWHSFKVPYTKTENDVSIDLTKKAEVEYKVELVEKQEVQNSINEAVKEKDKEITTLKNELEEKEKSFNSLKEELATSKEKEVSLMTSVNELNDKIKLLNEYKDKMEVEEYERQLNEKKEEYKVKFNSFAAMERFEEEDVQQHIKDTLDETKSVNAKLALADILLECAVPFTGKVNNARQEGEGSKTKEPLKNIYKLGSGEKPVVRAADLL